MSFGSLGSLRNETLVVAMHQQQFALPAALVAYLDPLSGVIPMSQAAGAGITSGVAMKLLDKDTTIENSWVMEGAITAVGTLLGGYLFGNFMEPRMAAALGAWVSASFGLSLIYR